MLTIEWKIKTAKLIHDLRLPFFMNMDMRRRGWKELIKTLRQCWGIFIGDFSNWFFYMIIMKNSRYYWNIFASILQVHIMVNNNPLCSLLPYWGIMEISLAAPLAGGGDHLPVHGNVFSSVGLWHPDPPRDQPSRCESLGSIIGAEKWYLQGDFRICLFHVSSSGFRQLFDN